jgi:hypothetical protein
MGMARASDSCMGLAERRVIEELKKGAYAMFVGKVKEITNLDVEIETNWVDIGQRMEDRADKAADLLDFMDNCFMKPILGSLSAVCADEMGREALAGSFKKIVIKSDEDASGHEGGFAFEDGILTVNRSYSNTDDVAKHTKAMTELLESKL